MRTGARKNEAERWAVRLEAEDKARLKGIKPKVLSAMGTGHAGIVVREKHEGGWEVLVRTKGNYSTAAEAHEAAKKLIGKMKKEGKP